MERIICEPTPGAEPRWVVRPLPEGGHGVFPSGAGPGAGEPPRAVLEDGLAALVAAVALSLADGDDDLFPAPVTAASLITDGEAGCGTLSATAGERAPGERLLRRLLRSPEAVALLLHAAGHGTEALPRGSAMIAPDR